MRQIWIGPHRGWGASAQPDSDGGRDRASAADTTTSEATAPPPSRTATRHTRGRLPPLLLAALVVLAFLNVLPGGFVFDGHFPAEPARLPPAVLADQARHALAAPLPGGQHLQRELDRGDEMTPRRSDWWKRPKRSQHLVAGDDHLRE